jgi:hypothetical protein
VPVTPEATLTATLLVPPVNMMLFPSSVKPLSAKSIDWNCVPAGKLLWAAVRAAPENCS